MLGRFADQFFAKQSRERVLAMQPNAEGQSYHQPDMGLRGTGKIATVSGFYETPGPQNTVSANAAFMPGMAGTECAGLPGMGEVSIPKWAPWAAVAAVAGWFILRKRSA
jgi:hypothetical protein